MDRTAAFYSQPSYSEGHIFVTPRRGHPTRGNIWGVTKLILSLANTLLDVLEGKKK